MNSRQSRRRRIEMAVHAGIQILAISALCFVITACPKVDRADQARATSEESELDKILAVADLDPSRDLSHASLLTAKCDVTASDYIGPVVHTRVGRDQMLFGCLKLYACSPVASEIIENFRRDEKFVRLGSFNLDQIEPDTNGMESIHGEAVTAGGLFFPNRRVILLSSRVHRQFDACTLLLHELTHQLDKNVYGKLGGTSELRAEMQAYWNEFAFQDELALSENVELLTILQEARAKNGTGPGRLFYTTTRGLHDFVSNSYRLPRDESAIQEFPSLPLESKIKRLGK